MKPQTIDRPPSITSRILYVDHCALMSGGEIALLNLVKSLDRTRFTPLVLLFSEGPLVAALRSAGVETQVVLLDRSIADTRKDALGLGTMAKMREAVLAARFVWALRRIISELDIDVVHTNSLKADILGGAAARLARKPLIWHVRDRIADDYLPPAVTRLFRFLSGAIPHVVIANSASTLESIHRTRDDHSAVVYSGTNMRDGNVVHDGLNANAFDGRRTTRPGEEDASIIGLLGRISPWKGQHIFIRAAAIVLTKFPRARFRIIGKVMFDEADYEKQIQALVHQLGIAHAIEFVGFRSDVATALAELDLLVHASTTGEPFGQVIVEGMAAGLPVVATDGGGVPEIVIHGNTGLLVPMNNVEAMAEAITQILSDPKSAGEMGRSGKVRAREVFSIDKTARAVEAIYERLLRDRE